MFKLCSYAGPGLMDAKLTVTFWTALDAGSVQT